MTGLLTDAIDDLFERLKYDCERYIRQYWWRFVGRESDPEIRAWHWQHRPRLWPPFWGHRRPLGVSIV